jgi:YidC/Oxa1 family membrane protein insertase
MLNQLVLDSLLWLTQFTNNLGLSIVVFTILIKLVLIPITQKSVESAQQMKELAPELKKLQKKYPKNPKALQEAQLALYKQHNINPIAGCLPQLIQIGLLIVLYRALINFFNQVGNGSSGYDLNFLWMDISQPDKLFILPIAVGVAQLGLSWLMSWTEDKQKNNKSDQEKKKKVKDESASANFADSMAQMQKQMLYIMPVMTSLIALGLPSGLILYWLFSSLFTLGQQAYVMRNKIFQRLKYETN